MMLGGDVGCDKVEDIEDIVTQDDEIIKHTSTKKLILPHVRMQTKAAWQKIEECVQTDSIIPGRQHHKECVQADSIIPGRQHHDGGCRVSKPFVCADQML